MESMKGTFPDFLQAKITLGAKFPTCPWELVQLKAISEQKTRVKNVDPPRPITRVEVFSTRVGSVLPGGRTNPDQTQVGWVGSGP